MNNMLWSWEHTTSDDKFWCHLFSSFSNNRPGGLV